MILRLVYSLFLVATLLVGEISYAYTSPGAPLGYVSDFAVLIDDASKQQLEETLKQAADAGNQIAVVTIETLGGDDVESYANTLFREWGIGGVDTNRGILVLIAQEEREIRIEVGYGLEGEMPDAIANRIIDTEMVPYLRDGRYGDGLIAGVNAILEELETPGVSAESQTSGAPTAEEWWYIVVFAYVALSWIIGIMSRTKEWVLGGIFGAVVSVVLGAIFGATIGVSVALPLILIGLVIDYVVSHGYRQAIQNGTTPPWWTGGTFGGGSGGFRGGGGFGGFGGGSSGGGGASGRF